MIHAICEGDVTTQLVEGGIYNIPEKDVITVNTMSSF